MLTILDSHVHFWQPDVLRYDWLGELPTLNRPFLPADLPREGDGWKVDKVVFVQADCAPEQGLREAAWVSELAKAGAPIAGIVAFAPLELGEGVRESLEQLAALPLVKGVRRLIQSEADGFSTQRGFVEGARLLADYGYSFDLCIRHHQMPDVIALVGACPNVQFVLDHIGKPGIKAAQLDPWRDHVQQLAALPNVFCKLSGLVTEAHTERWTPADLQPYIDHVLNCFGITRVMFGSDWPVVRLAATYERWIAVALAATSHCTAEEHRLLFYENARRFYGL